jgi:hypothetical protein
MASGLEREFHTRINHDYDKRFPLKITTKKKELTGGFIAIHPDLF